jgi:hypothetical protein
VAHADHALYAAKGAGKSRVMIYEPAGRNVAAAVPSGSPGSPGTPGSPLANHRLPAADGRKSR